MLSLSLSLASWLAGKEECETKRRQNAAAQPTGRAKKGGAKKKVRKREDHTRYISPYLKTIENEPVAEEEEKEKQETGEARTARYSRVIKQWNNLLIGVPCSAREARNVVPPVS